MLQNYIVSTSYGKIEQTTNVKSFIPYSSQHKDFNLSKIKIKKMYNERPEGIPNLLF